MVDAFSDFRLADDYKNNSHCSIDILVCLDACWGLMDPEIKPHQGNGLIAQKSVFGWVFICLMDGFFLQEILGLPKCCAQEM